MLQWLRLAVWLLLSATVSGRDVECYDIHYTYCLNSQTLGWDNCWACEIRYEKINNNDLIFILPKHRNGTDAEVEFMTFIASNVTKLPKIFHKKTYDQFLKVRLWGTKTRVLNSQFFGKAAQHLIDFQSYENYNLSVEASAFRNCAALERLDLYGNEILSIPPDAFLGLHKLIRLDLDYNKLTEINENWFVELANLEVLNLSVNQLVEIADTAFDKLHKLQELNLNKNKIEIVTGRMFKNNQQLQKISLYKNQIKVIQPGTFAHLSKLSKLNLDDNDCINTTFIKKNSEEISAALTACSSLCVIPQIPNGYIVNAKNNVTQTVGESLETFDSVKVVCNFSFLLFHEKETQQINVCTENDWTRQDWPKCERE